MGLCRALSRPNLVSPVFPVKRNQEIEAFSTESEQPALGYDARHMSTSTKQHNDSGPTKSSEAPSGGGGRHFIRQIIDEHIEAGKWGAAGDGTVVKTRFPPEPNGYLHIGHAKAICINFGLAQEYGGSCNLRFDDTNPSKEDQEYVDAIIEDIRWLGFEWEGEPKFASDYFGKMHAWAVELIGKGLAYVDDQTPDEIRATRGTLKEPGSASPFRDRPVEESLDLFARMTAGEFDEGSRVLRAKIDMASPNLNLRDPIMYRVLHASHHRTGDTWHVYPMYDWAHGLEDSIEGITHSLCTLEFENHRPLYDWFIENLEGVHHPQQIEFARLNFTYTIMSKRKLLTLVKDGHVNGWDDPRMATLSGYRRRGYPAKAIRNLCEDVGLSKTNSLIDLVRLENSARDVLNKTALRRMAVLDPLKVVITNYAEGQTEQMDAVNNPEDESAGTRKVPFSREIYIERADFMEDAPKKFFRLAPDKEVRLRSAYWIKCTEVIKDADGTITELRATYDPETRGGGNPPDGRKVKGTLHWVSAAHAIDAEVRLYDRLFSVERPEKDKDGKVFTDHINPDSLTTITNAKLEPTLADANVADVVQFERLGYFCKDRDSTDAMPVFSRTVTLKDSWAKQAKK